jgi:hypothetical protein
MSGKTLQAARRVSAEALQLAGHLPTDCARGAWHLSGTIKSIIAFIALILTPARAQPVWEGLPFGPGEELTFQVRSSRFGKIGKAVMRVSRDTIRGRDVYRLSFDFSARILLFNASDQTRSWLDPASLTSLRYTKRERSPVVKRDENVEIFPDEQRWTMGAGSFASATTEPLDELSFLYYLRTLSLEDGASYTCARHFDPARNPVSIRVLKREVLPDPAGTYQTVVVEMRVPDTRQDKGYSLLRLHLTDDFLHVPVRIESSMPVGGTMTMVLQSRQVF